MDNIYIVLVGILFIAAISDLIVGVSNDAVNFLNSAIGSKVAPFKVIMIVASLGVLVGATFSNGMMEVARKGIFHPEHFYFSEIMIIFLAVMLTDILLLDLFNTLGLPTSTTVSIVFELLGAAVAMSIIKIYKANLDISEIGTFINSAKALAIITGILFSVIVAFVSGAVIQYFARILFSFNYKKTKKYFGAIWGGFAITAITYFLLIKGAKGSSMISAEQLNWIKSNTIQIIVYGFIGWTLILQFLYGLFKINILKITVLLGTFALAMAFAGNDLVNFIGVPLAGLKSFQFFNGSGVTDPNSFLMANLTGKVKTETYLLLFAGLVMVLTLWFSRKARRVVGTSIDLSRQDEGDERFGASLFSRIIVRMALKINDSFEAIIPRKMLFAINKRFDQSVYKKDNKENDVSFDLVRASVNLVVASILIALATSYKLPLSTTYVTFMVAMGTSLSDRAWGRESAVYRVSGVTTVIGGWFLTAFVAFTCAFLLAFIIYYGGTIAIFAIIAVAIVILYRTHIAFRSKEKEEMKVELEAELSKSDTEKVIATCSNNILNTLSLSRETIANSVSGLFDEDRKLLKKTNKEVASLNKNTKKLKDNVHKTIEEFGEDFAESGHYYVQVLDYLREIVHSVTFIYKPITEHVENNHKPFSSTQKAELKSLTAEMNKLIKEVEKIIESKDFTKLNKLISVQQAILDNIADVRKSQIKRIKSGSGSTKTSLLFLNVLAETKNLLLYTINALKSYRDFSQETKRTD